MQDKLIPDEWYDLLIKLTGSHLRASIVTFLCSHPHLRFNEGVVPCAEDYQISDVLNCLGDLVEEGVIETFSQNGATLYGLTDREPWQSLMAILSGLDPYQRRNLLQHRKWIPSDQGQYGSGEQAICG